MFLGEYVYLMHGDEGNRLTIPAKFRDELEEKIFITKETDSYLRIYSKKEWEKLIEGWKKLDLKGIEYRRFWRAICSKTEEIELQAEGECSLPRHLMEHAGLKRVVVFVGCNKYIELWDKERWEAKVERKSLKK